MRYNGAQRTTWADGHGCYIPEDSSPGSVPIPARCMTPRLVHNILRVALLAAGCWPLICTARPPQVRSVRVPVIDRADIPFSHVSLEASPVRGNIFRIVQDDQGFLWFGTNHGLLRYDG